MSTRTKSLPAGSLHVVRGEGKGGQDVLYWEGRWYRGKGKTRGHKRLGRAHIVKTENVFMERPKSGPETEKWERFYKKKRTAPTDGALKVDEARSKLREAIRADFDAMARFERYGSMPTIQEAADRWLEQKRRQGRSANTLSNYATYIGPEGKIMREFGTRQLDKITEQDVETFLDRLEDEYAASARSVNGHRQVLLAVFKWGIRNAGLLVNPVEYVTPRTEKVAETIVPFSEEQVHAIARRLREGTHRHPDHRKRGQFSKLEHFRARRRADAQDAVAVIVSAYSGLRQGELLALRWRDVDLVGDGGITVSRSYSESGGEDTTKSRRTRSVPMLDETRIALAARKNASKHTRPNDLVFYGEDGSFLSSSALRKRFQKALQAVQDRDDADIQVRSWHHLRHTFCSWMVQLGEDVVAIKEWAGHSSITVTERYMHHRPKRDDAARISAKLQGSGAKALLAEPAEASV